MKTSIVSIALSLLALAVSAQELPRIISIPGGIALVALTPSTQPAPLAYFSDQRVMVVKHRGYWQALVGLPLSLAPGRHAVTFMDRTDTEHERLFEVRPKDYAVQHLTMKQKRFVEPTAEDLNRIGRDREIIHAAFGTWTAHPVPSLRFDPPTHGRFSSGFGLRRFFNNQPRQPHSGIDIAAPQGATVVAPAPGVVLETGNYFFNGNTVFLNHGQGLISMFNHMKKVLVAPGMQVARGQQIGEIGMTGRVTGPHLHWSVSLNNSRIDPVLFMTDEVQVGAQRQEGTARSP